MSLREQTLLVKLIWGFLAVDFAVSVVLGRWSVAFVSLAALGLSLAPALLAERFHLRLPVNFVAAIVLFAFATLFLGEVLDFYERYWWWDIVLHGFSAVMFGMVGFVFAFFLFEGDRYAAPPLALAFIAMCFAISIGVFWEIFEFAMDQFFGLNMQKSGLVDTMWDLIVDVIGAGLGAASGYFYQTGAPGWASGMIDDFVRGNRRLFRRFGQDRKNRKE